MGRYNSTPRRREAERKYPWRVDLIVPPNGFGQQLIRMHAATTHPVHLFKFAGETGQIATDALRFYFPDEEQARAFGARWGGAVNERPPEKRR